MTSFDEGWLKRTATRGGGGLNVSADGGTGLWCCTALAYAASCGIMSD
jgi:hypothetical protein